MLFCGARPTACCSCCFAALADFSYIPYYYYYNKHSDDNSRSVESSAFRTCDGGRVLRALPVIQRPKTDYATDGPVITISR